jgi:hypothetical protein
MARSRGKYLPPVEEADFDGSNHPPPDTSLQDEVERLKEIGEVNLLEEARKASIRLLLAKLNLGDISAPELAVLRNLLRDNGMIINYDPGAEERPSQVGFHLPDLEDDE